MIAGHEHFRFHDGNQPGLLRQCRVTSQSMGISKRATGCALGFGSLKHLIVFGLGGPFFHKLFASVRPSSSSSPLGMVNILCPFVPGTGSQRSVSNANSKSASFGSISRFSVNSRLAYSHSFIDALSGERPLMTASSHGRSRTIAPVTVPRPTEFPVKAPCLSGLVFIKVLQIFI